MAEYAVAEFNDSEVKDFLKNLKKKVKNIKDGQNRYVGLLSAIVYSDVINHFEEEKGSKGPWKEWSPSYKKHLEEIKRSKNQILQFSGRLRQSFLPTNVKTSNQGIVWFNNAKTKSGFPYAYAHDSGGPKLPQRDFMWLSEKALEKIEVRTLQFMIDEGI